MSYFSQSTIFVITTFLILLPSSSSTTPLISQTCKKIAHGVVKDKSYTNCVRLLESDRRSESAKTVEELGVFAFKAVGKEFVGVVPRLKELSRSSKFDAFVKRSLEFCAERYSDEVESVDDALEAYKMKDYDTANVQISAAMTAPTDCEDVFEEREGYTSPVTKLDNDLFELCAIPLAFTRLTTTHSLFG